MAPLKVIVSAKASGGSICADKRIRKFHGRKLSYICQKLVKFCEYISEAVTGDVL